MIFELTFMLEKVFTGFYLSPLGTSTTSKCYDNPSTLPPRPPCPFFCVSRNSFKSLDFSRRLILWDSLYQLKRGKYKLAGVLACEHTTASELFFVPKPRHSLQVGEAGEVRGRQPWSRRLGNNDAVFTHFLQCRRQIHEFKLI